MSEKYSISGRVDSFEYESVSVNSVDKLSGDSITGITGGSITWDYNSDLKVSGSLTTVDSPMIHNRCIRIYYVSKIPVTQTGGGMKWHTYRYCLATCYGDIENGHYENGKYSGKINLQGTMSRFIDDKIPKNYVVSAQSKALTHFRNIFKWLGGQYKISGVTDRKYTSAKVWEFGTTPITILKDLSSYVSGELTCDRTGHIVLKKKIAASKIPVTYSIPTGKESVTLPGIDITSTQGKASNQAAVLYLKQEEYSVQDGTYKTNINGHRKGDPKYITKTRQVPIYGLAKIASTNSVSKSKTGRFRTYTEKLSNMKPETTARANAIAASRLNTNSRYTTVYTIHTYFLPISIGQVVQFKYDKISIDGFVESIDYDLSPGCPMTIQLRKIRSH